jgi:hypothetical protein
MSRLKPSRISTGPESPMPDSILWSREKRQNIEPSISSRTDTRSADYVKCPPPREAGDQSKGHRSFRHHDGFTFRLLSMQSCQKRNLRQVCSQTVAARVVLFVISAS